MTATNHGGHKRVFWRRCDREFAVHEFSDFLKVLRWFFTFSLLWPSWPVISSPKSVGRAQVSSIQTLSERKTDGARAACVNDGGCIWPSAQSIDSPALQIHSRYPFSSRSICCCRRNLRKALRLSTRSLSLANSLDRPRWAQVNLHRRDRHARNAAGQIGQ